MKLWNLNTGEEAEFTEEQIKAWLWRTRAQCLARHDDVSYWRTICEPYFTEIWRIEP